MAAVVCYGQKELKSLTTVLSSRNKVKTKRKSDENKKKKKREHTRL